MNAEELRKQQLEKNALAEGLTTLAAKAKTGRLVNPKVIGAVAVLALAVGLWWYFSSKSKKDASRRWTDFESATTADGFKKVADDHPGTPVALPARLAAARVRLTGDGLARLNKPAERAKGVESVAKARDEFAALAGDFQKAGDRTLQAECLRLAALAESALVGVGKPGVSPTDALNPANQLGSVDKAVGFYNEAAKAIGETTPAGVRLKKQADELAAAAARPDNGGPQTPLALGRFIDNNIPRESPEARPEPKAPDRPLDPIAPPEPPAGTVPPLDRARASQHAAVEVVSGRWLVVRKDKAAKRRQVRGESDTWRVTSRVA